MTFLNPTFVHPGWLLAFVLPLVVAAACWISTKQRKQRAVTFGDFTTVGSLGDKSSAHLCHIVVINALLSLVLVITSLAGSMPETRIAHNRATVMLVVDVSLSIPTIDVAPGRITAAKEADQESVENLPDDLNIGLVMSSSRARTVVSLTTNHDTVDRAFQVAELDQATVTGGAIVAVLDAINQSSDPVQDGGEGAPPTTIVLLSDGKQTVPQELDDPRGMYTTAAEATKVGAPVDTISFGTTQGAIMVQGELIPMPNDDDSLRETVRRTEGGFSGAGSLRQLRDAYSSLEDDIGYELKRTENPRSYLVAAFVILLVAVGSPSVANRQVPQ